MCIVMGRVSEGLRTIRDCGCGCLLLVVWGVAVGSYYLYENAKHGFYNVMGIPHKVIKDYRGIHCYERTGEPNQT